MGARGLVLPGIMAVGLCLAAVSRCGADEASAVLAQHQASVDDAVERGLQYLARNQVRGGSFASGMSGNTGIASLCAMAFLAQGHVPGNGPYGEVIDRGIDFVLASQQKNGMLVGETKSHGPMYSHTISALMLSEISGMVDPPRQAKVDTALAEALRVILAAQQVEKGEGQQGGWRYQHNSRDSDISCTGWALMALRSSRNNGAAVPREAVDEAVGFVMNCQSTDGGFAYQPGKTSGLARTGTALLCLELCGRHREDACVSAGNWVLKNLPADVGQEYFYYGLYYCFQGMFQLGGEHWETFASHMFPLVLGLQDVDGSWPEGPDNESRAGSCYSTAMAILAMSVVYRQLPIYQR